MNCPKCGSKFRVANTASTDDTPRMHLRNMCNELIQWYCADYVVRQRVCNKCLYVTVTVEVERSDLIDMFRILAHEDVPDQLKQYIGEKSVSKDKEK